MWRPKRGDDRDLERQVDALVSEARAAGARGDLVGQARRSGDALDTCRVLVERHPGDVRHLAVWRAACTTTPTD